MIDLNLRALLHRPLSIIVPQRDATLPASLTLNCLVVKAICFRRRQRNERVVIQKPRSIHSPRFTQTVCDRTHFLFEAFYLFGRLPCLSP
jgi:hypothetical protein